MRIIEQINAINENLEKTDKYQEILIQLMDEGVIPRKKPKYEIIEDNTGRWVRDNTTGIEISLAIGERFMDDDMKRWLKEQNL